MIEEEIAVVLCLDGGDTAVSAGLSGRRPRLRDQNVPREQAGRWEEEASRQRNTQSKCPGAGTPSVHRTARQPVGLEPSQQGSERKETVRGEMGSDVPWRLENTGSLSGCSGSELGSLGKVLNWEGMWEGSLTALVIFAETEGTSSWPV